MTRHRRLHGPGHLMLATGATAMAVLAGTTLAVLAGFGTANDAGTRAHLAPDGPPSSGPISDGGPADRDPGDLSSPSATEPTRSPSPSRSPARRTPRPTVSITPSATRSAPRADRSRTTPSSSPRTSAPSSPARTTTAPSSTTSAAAAAASSQIHDAQESEVLRLVNVERSGAGCGPVTADATLAKVARAHSKDMAVNKYFDHNSQDGRTPFDRMRAAGYAFSTAAENIAAGQQTASAVMESWMNSPGHRANILNCSLKELGVGRWKQSGSPYGIYWTQDFGTP